MIHLLLWKKKMLICSIGSKNENCGEVAALGCRFFLDKNSSLKECKRKINTKFAIVNKK